MEDIMPVDSAFTGGTLEISREPLGPASTNDGSWNMLTDALIIASVFAAILFIRRLIDIIPSLIGCAMRWKEAFNLEYSTRLCRSRDIIFGILIIPFCLMLSRYSIYSPGFLEGLETSSRVLAIIGIVAGYILLRALLSYSFRGKKTDRTTYAAADKAFRTFFCTCTLVLLPTAGILSLTGLPDCTVKTVLIYVLCALYLLFVLRKFQIFNNSCNVFTTILYLCTLEFLPTGLLVAPALVF
ncbi:MAG: DUF4271 domain-containing protein [Bacteroidales bacterium]|nr:DUF4271 domain-containing protein [Bacteroidales bacterium]